MPSATEIVVRLGAGDQLVGRSEECDFPPEVRKLPVVMRAKALDGDLPSRDIDGRVQAVRGRAESLYRLDLDLLRSLRPDLIITQDLCGVCSVTDAEVIDACRQAGVAPEVLSLSPSRLADVWESVRQVGEALGRTDAGRDLARELNRDQDGRGPVFGNRVAVVEWIDPVILAGLWVPDMIREAGGTALGPRSGEPGLRTEWSEIWNLEPDLVIVSPCSFPVSRTEREIREIRTGSFRLAHGGWIADEAYFSRPGPRLADGVELLGNLLRDQPVANRSMPTLPWIGAAARSEA